MDNQFFEQYRIFHNPWPVYTRFINRKQYEITDHSRAERSRCLGSTRVVVNDRALVTFSEEDGSVTYACTDVLSLLNYYPGGQLQPGMTWENSLYRYGYNTQERTDELYGPGNFYTAQFWEYDTRIWRRWNMDPVRYTGVSVYTVFFNNPVYFVDPFGAEGQGSDACPECSTPLVFEVVANKIGPGFASSIVMNAIVGYNGPGSFRVPMSLPMVTSEQYIPDQNSESRQLLDYFSNNIPIYSPMEDFQHQVDAGNFTQAYISLARAYVDAFTFRSMANSKGSSSRAKYHKPKLSSGGSPNVMLNQSTNKSVLNILMPDGIAIGTVEAREASIRTVTKKEAEV